MTAEQFVSSRKVKKEKQKAIKQTLALLGAAVGILVIFVFIILPGFINGFNSFLDSSNPFQPTDTIPPQVPILSAPVEATFSARVAVTGFGEPESTLVVVLNGQKAPEITIASDGSFSTEVELTEGENTIAAYAVDTAGNESELSRTFRTELDMQPPTLELKNVEDNQTIETRKNQDYRIEGTTDPGSKVFVNGRLVLPNQEGAFAYTYHLAEGENKLVFEAVDKAGNSTKVERTLQFEL